MDLAGVDTEFEDICKVKEKAIKALNELENGGMAPPENDDDEDAVMDDRNSK